MVREGNFRKLGVLVIDTKDDVEIVKEILMDKGIAVKEVSITGKDKSLELWIRDSYGI